MDSEPRRADEAAIDLLRLQYQLAVGHWMLENSKEQRSDRPVAIGDDPGVTALERIRMVVIEAERLLAAMIEREGLDSSLARFLLQSEALFLLLLAGLSRPSDDQGASEHWIWSREQLLDELEGDAWRTPAWSEALANFVQHHCALDYRARYNLACYLARAGKLAQAEDQLLAVFAEAPADLQAWAHKDPALEALRNPPRGPFKTPASKDSFSDD